MLNKLLILILVLGVGLLAADVFLDGERIDADVRITTTGSAPTPTLPAPTPPPPTPPPPTPPAPPPPTSGNCATPSLSGRVVSWAAVFGDSFPSPNGLDKVINIGGSGYMAIKFNIGDIKARGAIGLIETTTASGTRFGSISECPGDFSVLKPCSQSWGVSEVLRWGTQIHNSLCHLDDNKNYYLNFTFTDGVNANTGTCSGGSCVIRVAANFGLLE